jgi:hypothetical protein
MTNTEEDFPARDDGAAPAAHFTELNILRLAAMALDLRGSLTPYVQKQAPSLVTALDAFELVFEEMGWGNSSRDSPDTRLRQRLSGDI